MTVFVPSLLGTLEDALRAIQQLSAGRSNAVGTVTLAVSPATSTTVTSRNCAAGTVPILVPTTANAAAAMSGVYVPTATIGNGTFVIQHASSAQTDRTYLFALHG